MRRSIEYSGSMTCRHASFIELPKIKSRRISLAAAADPEKEIQNKKNEMIRTVARRMHKLPLCSVSGLPVEIYIMEGAHEYFPPRSQWGGPSPRVTKKVTLTAGLACATCGGVVEVDVPDDTDALDLVRDIQRDWFAS